MKPTIHLEDDELTSMVWKLSAKKNGVELISFSSAKDLFKEIENFECDSDFYIDFDLAHDEINGVQVCEQLYERGFINLYLSTGHDPKEFSKYEFIQNVIGKECPF